MMIVASSVTGSSGIGNVPQELDGAIARHAGQRFRVPILPTVDIPSARALETERARELAALPRIVPAIPDLDTKRLEQNAHLPRAGPRAEVIRPAVHHVPHGRSDFDVALVLALVT